MFLALWNYIRGYVIIYVTGFSVERFINMAVNKGIFIWDVIQEKNMVIMKASVKNADDLKECGIKTGCRFEIKGEYGLPVFIRHCSSKKAYIAGILLFSVSMYIMSSFIWTVRVNGNERLNADDIIRSCAEKGIAPGKMKHGVDLYEVGEKLMMEYKDIAWIAVDMKGTGVVVNIVETIPKTQYVDREKPIDVVANADGVIVSVAASSGTPMVKEGDEVKKGDLLISSEVPLKDGENKTGEMYVCASGEVYAEKQYELEGISELNYNEKVFTGKAKTDYSVNIFGHNFNFITPSYENDYEVITDDRLKFDIGDYEIPFGINKTVYGQVEKVKMKRTEDEAVKLAEKQLNDRITALTMETGGEVSRLETETITDGNRMIIKGHTSVIMRIDEQREAETSQYEEVTE